VLEERYTLVGMSNSQWTGDGMWIAPRADVSDGKLDLLTLAPISRLELIKLFPRIFSGTHLAHPAVKAATARRVTIAPSKPGPLLADGEVFGTTPVTVEVLPGALSMLV
jgi:diacylglycerol kinase (ATP)